MKIEEYIELLEEHRDSLESDAQDIETAVDELTNIIDCITSASGLDELKDAIESLESLDFEPNDLIIPDLTPLNDNFDVESWINDFKSSVGVIESKPEEEKKE